MAESASAATTAANSNRPSPPRNPGQVPDDLGGTEAAIASYREALRLDPGDHEAAVALAEALAANNRTSEANDVLRAVSDVLEARRPPEVPKFMWPEYLEGGPARTALEIVKLLEEKDGKLLINVSVGSDAQFLSELDNFASMRALREISPDGFHIYLGPRTERTTAFAEMYGEAICSGYILTDYAPEMARSIALFRPELTVDVGISAAKCVPMEGRTARPAGARGGHFTYLNDRPAQEKDIENYYRRRRDLSGAAPLARRFEFPVELDPLIALRGRRLALVCHEGSRGEHIGDAAPTGPADPETFIPAIEFLRGNGFQIVHVGRAPYPACYGRLDVADYAGSAQATFKNDLVLLSTAAICISNNAELTAIAGVMGTPVTATNVWDLSHPPISGSCTYTLSRAKDRETGALESFDAQLELQATPGAQILESHLPVDSDAADILAAMQETLEFVQAPPPLREPQRRYQALASRYPCSDMASSRISAAFAERHRDFL